MYIARSSCGCSKCGRRPRASSNGSSDRLSSSGLCQRSPTPMTRRPRWDWAVRTPLYKSLFMTTHFAGVR
jgi:hypothetical protein